MSLTSRVLQSYLALDIIYADVDMSSDLIDGSVKDGAKGIVIAGVGNGT